MRTHGRFLYIGDLSESKPPPFHPDPKTSTDGLERKTQVTLGLPVWLSFRLSRKVPLNSIGVGFRLLETVMRRDVRTLKVWSHYVRKNFLVPSPVFFGSPRFNCSKRSSGSLPLGTGTGLVESCQNLRELNRVHRPVSRLTTFPGKVRRVGKPQSEGRSVQTNSRSINIAKPWILKILYGTNLS